MLCGSHIQIWNTANHMKKTQTKNIRCLSSKIYHFDVFFVLFFIWFPRFQILICEPQSIWRSLFALSWLYPLVSIFTSTWISILLTNYVPMIAMIITVWALIKMNSFHDRDNERQIPFLSEFLRESERFCWKIIF